MILCSRSISQALRKLSAWAMLRLRIFITLPFHKNASLPMTVILGVFKWWIFPELNDVSLAGRKHPGWY
jgi:hypothetical protein